MDNKHRSTTVVWMQKKSQKGKIQRERERETKKQRTVLHAGLILNVACGNADSYTDGDCVASGHGGAGTNNRTDESLIYNGA